jgi:hypothetical protein
MITTMPRFRILLFCLLLLLCSCTNPFHPNLRTSETSNPANDSPAAVLKSLEQAYTQKNIKLFMDCLAPDYRFELLSAEVSSIGIDWNDDGIKDDWWGYEQEVEYHRNLFTEGSSDGSYPPPDQIDLNLQIPPEAQWEPDPQVGHEGWWIIPCPFILQLLYTSSNSSMSSSGVARFYLKQIGTRWFIAIWRDESYI